MICWLAGVVLAVSLHAKTGLPFADRTLPA